MTEEFIKLLEQLTEQEKEQALTNIISLLQEEA